MAPLVITPVSISCLLKPCMRFSRTRLTDNLLSTAFRFPYAGGFFGTAFPDSTSLPRPSSSYDGLGSLLSSGTWLALRRCKIHFMLRTAVSRVLLELFSSLRHTRSPSASEDSYPTLWRLSGLDLHQQAYDSFRMDHNNL